MADDVKPPMFPTLDSLEVALWPGAILVVFVATAVLVDLMIILSTRFRMLDLPNRRSAHALPTARGGGIAIVMLVCIAAALSSLRWPQLASRLLMGVVLPGLTIAILGVIDDLRPLKALLRLAIQIGVACFMTFILGPLEGVGLPGLGTWQLGPLAWPITVLWIVGMINAYNFMDGSDGMAALGAVVCGTFMAAVGFETRSLAAMVLAAFAAASAAGFLVFNWQPARIFMGDAGSGFLGLFFAAIPLLFNEPKESTFVAATLCLWPYIYDTLLSVLRRVWHGQNPFQPHREFLFHRLIRSGVSHASAAILYAMLSAIGGLVGLIITSPNAPDLVKQLCVGSLVALAIGITFVIERRCRLVGLPSAATRYSSALH